MPSTWKKSGSSTSTRVKRETRRNLDSTSAHTETWEGSLTDLTSTAASYPVGAVITDLYGGSLTVKETVLTSHTGGPKAQLVVQADNATTSSPGGGGGSSSDTVYELRYERVDKDIRTHRMFQSGGTYALTAAMFDAVAAWEAETDATKRTTKYNDLHANAQHLADKINRGQTSYPIWVPVAVKTYRTTSAPTISSVGTVSTPPTQCKAPATSAEGKAYIYVLMEDSMIRERGVYRRTMQWMGFDEVDTEIYTNS